MTSILRPIKALYEVFGIDSLHKTGRNAYIIIIARSLRMFAYATNNLILAIFFSALGYSDHQIGAFLTLTLIGDVVLATLLTLVADRVGRRKVLLAGSLLMITSGVAFALFENYWILLLAAVTGVLSVTGGDFGPFRTIEESIISELTTFSTRSDVLAWYITLSAFGSSIGSEASGRIIHSLQERDGWTQVDAYHALFWIFAAAGCVNTLLVLALDQTCELQADIVHSQLSIEPDEINSLYRHEDFQRNSLRLSKWEKAKTWAAMYFSQISAPTRSTMYKLWFLLMVDSLADGMVPYSLTTYYMDIKFHPAKSTLGDITSASYFLAAIGSSFAGPLARKLGLINTMVFTHVPSSSAVLAFPLPQSLWMTTGLLLLRAGLNNMDQAPRSAFIAAVVKPEERTAAMGITTMVRTLASTAGPSITGLLAADESFWIAFVMAGACRLVYDFGLYFMFVNMKIERSDAKLETGRSSNLVDEHDEENEVEMASLLSSDSEAERKDLQDVPGPKNHKASLHAPTDNRARSRSPRRLDSID